jgi:glyoxylase-like metal-dependent hydrolase (beta-lactamase superfamily II)
VILKKLVVGSLMTNCYILAAKAGGEAVVIDPGEEGPEILKALKEDSLKLKYIINTHGHFDHVGDDAYLKEATGAVICLHSEEAFIKPDIVLKDGRVLEVEGINIRVIETPGHSGGSISLLVDGKLFTGDLLFSGSVGRTDLPGGSFEALSDSLRKISSLPEETEVYPGHGPETTLGQERRTNPYMTEL